MLENSISNLTTSMSRFAFASTMFFGRAMASMLRGDVMAPMRESMAAFSKGLETMAHVPGNCGCQAHAPQQAAGSGWGPVHHDN